MRNWERPWNQQQIRHVMWNKTKEELIEKIVELMLEVKEK